jgi:hypothetical protein
MKKIVLNFAIVFNLVLVISAQQQSPNLTNVDFLNNNISNAPNNSSLKFIQKNISSNDKLTVRNFENLTRIEEILNLFSIEEIGRQWVKLNDKLNPICAYNMLEYLSGLEKRKIWAVKSEYFYLVLVLKLICYSFLN